MTEAVRVTASTTEGRVVSFVATSPPTPAEIERLAGLAACPGLARAEWSVVAASVPWR